MLGHVVIKIFWRDATNIDLSKILYFENSRGRFVIPNFTQTISFQCGINYCQIPFANV